MGPARVHRGGGVAALGAVALILAACSGTEPVESPPSTSAGSTASDAGTSASGNTVMDFDCAGPIWSGPSGTADTRGVGVPGLMAITVDGPMVEWIDGSVERDGRHYQKVGLALRTGTEFELAVEPDQRDDVRIGWSNTGPIAAEALSIPGCPGDEAADEWVIYPGGFWVREPTCVGLEVTSAGGQEHVDVPVGAACP